MTCFVSTRFWTLQGPEYQAICSWARYLGVGTQGSGDQRRRAILEYHAIGSWARYQGGDEQSWNIRLVAVGLGAEA